MRKNVERDIKLAMVEQEVLYYDLHGFAEHVMVSLSDAIFDVPNAVGMSSVQFAVSQSVREQFFKEIEK